MLETYGLESGDCRSAAICQSDCAAQDQTRCREMHPVDLHGGYPMGRCDGRLERAGEQGSRNCAIAQAAGVVTGVKIEPDHVMEAPGDSRQFTGTVTGTGIFSAALKWSVNDVDGGNASLGTISSSGFYFTPYPARRW